MTTFAIRFIVIMFLFHFDVDLVVGHREGYPMSFFFSLPITLFFYIKSGDIALSEAVKISSITQIGGLRLQKFGYSVIGL